ncbi:MAG: InlB B-repeat-containing protein, partial [Clostridia bacterium]|nr:InlB B-repeat-containing protein [Clostridia bacterium]
DESGKQFGTWSSDGKTYNLGTMPPNDIELHAVWKVNTYTITFETDIGGTKIEAKEYEFGKTVAKVDDPVRTGYTFVRWEPSIPETMPSKDVTVVAVWDANDITISFDTAGGQPTSIAPVTQDYGTDATLPAAPTKKGHTFKGWLASNGTAYDALETIQMPSSNMKFTADWEVNKYTVKFDVNGGKAVDNMIDKDYGTVINVKTEKPGHKLSGWTGWTLDASGNKVGDGIFYKNLPTTIPDADMEFKAEWDCVDHFIYFHPAAIPVDDPETKDVDERLTADKNMITLEFDCNADIVTPTEAEVKAAGYDYETKIGIGKIIKGWNDADGNAIAAKMTYDMVGKHYVISAWVDELYTVTFDSNGGTSVPSQSLNYGDAIVEPAEPTKEGHDFVDWIDEKGYVVDFKNLKLTEAKNVTFTAKWQVKEYDVIWSVDEEEYKSETYEYGETIAKPKDPVKEGHTFTGWSGYTEGETKMGAADTVFEATWTVNEYKATFDPNGGVLIIKNKDGSVITTDEPYTFDIKYGNPVTAPELESRDGYVFSSWVDSADQQPMPATMPAKDVTFNALWNGAEGVKYTVYYYSMNTEGVYAKTEAGEYVYTSYKEDSGKTGTTASVTPKEIEGFTVDSGMSTLSGKITADGKLKLHVFYARNQYDLVTVVDGKETSRTAYYYEATIPTGAPELPKDTEEIDYPEVWTWAWASKDADGNPVVDTTKPATMPATEVTASMTSGPMLYTITLYSAGDMENPKVPYNTVFDVVTLGTPKMEGYTFAGWTDADENGKEVTTFTVTSDTKLYAQWTPDVYTATFYNSDPATNAKTGAPIGTKQIAYGEVVTYTAPTAPEGYKFKGWLADGVIYDGNDKMTVGNKDFVAQWTAVTE